MDLMCFEDELSHNLAQCRFQHSPSCFARPVSLFLLVFAIIIIIGAAAVVVMIILRLTRTDGGRDVTAVAESLGERESGARRQTDDGVPLISGDFHFGTALEFSRIDSPPG